MNVVVASCGLLLLWSAPFFALYNAGACVICVRRLRAGGPLVRGAPYAGVVAAGVGLFAATGGWAEWWMLYAAGGVAVADFLPSYGIVVCHVRDQPPARRDRPPKGPAP